MRSRCCLLILLLVACQQRDPAPAEGLEMDRAARRVTIPVTLRLGAFAAGDPPGHHLITWSEGRAGHKALLESPVSDVEVLDALEELGGEPGDTLSEESWTRRDDPAHPAPDRRAEGSAVRIALALPSGEQVPIERLLEDVDERGYAWRLAGNRALIDVWRSGCVVCLQSCPGAKIANREATMRDLQRGRARFRASDLARELGEGARLQVILALDPAAPR